MTIHDLVGIFIFGYSLIALYIFYLFIPVVMGPDPEDTDFAVKYGFWATVVVTFVLTILVFLISCTFPISLILLRRGYK